jgi:hypothetical protein
MAIAGSEDRAAQRPSAAGKSPSWSIASARLEALGAASRACTAKTLRK